MTVTRQVLAEPTVGLDEKTWARLADGTPLVTAARRGKGLIVLFHVTADTTWSNLPLSGLFVDMLRRVVAKAGPSVAAAANAADVDRSATFPPWRTLNGFGALGAPPAQAEPIAADFSGLGRRDPSARLLWFAGICREPSTRSPRRRRSPAPTTAGSMCGTKVSKSLPLSISAGGCCPAALVGLTIDAFISMWLAGGAGLRRAGRGCGPGASRRCAAAVLAPNSNRAAEH